MNQKTLDALFWIFTLLPFLIALFLLFILPETIPIHWTRQGPSEYGSKNFIVFITMLFVIGSIMEKQIMRFFEEEVGLGNTKTGQIIVRYCPLFMAFILFGASLWIFWLVTSATLFS